MKPNRIPKTSISFSITLFVFVFWSIFCRSSIAEIEWQGESGVTVNGVYSPEAYHGGISKARPTFVDIDNDGDYDLFIGKEQSHVIFYRNDGTQSSPLWILVSEEYASIAVEYSAAPSFCDIDNDGDYDMFVGKFDGTISFYRNDGVPELPFWTLVTENYNLINVVSFSMPTFCDIDADGDFDMFVGSGLNLSFYRNDGDTYIPSWTFITDHYYDPTYDMNAIIFCDIDSDGDFDMFGGHGDGTIIFHRNNGTPNDPYFPPYGGYLIDSIDLDSKAFPTFCDIDDDGDYDLFIGEERGNISLYENTGTPMSASWTFITNYYTRVIDAGTWSEPAFCDIDGDGDYDMFIGEAAGRIHFYRNDGSPSSPSWSLVSGEYNTIEVEYGMNKPTFCDIDNDDDHDMFIGAGNGCIYFYRNNGTSSAPLLTLITENYLSTEQGFLQMRSPVFCDIDNDGDDDMFVGAYEMFGSAEYGTIHYYRNDGSPTLPSWTFVTDNYESIKIIDGYPAPTFCDIDQDGDYDMFIGERYGRIILYQNDGAPSSPQWTLVSEDYNAIDIGHCSTPVFCDIDDDGDYDMFIGEYNGGINFWRNVTFVNTPPTTEIVSITPSPTYEGDMVSFEGNAADADEGDAVIAYRWTSNIDGLLSEKASFVIDTLSLGSHTIAFEAQDSREAWSEPLTTTLEVKPAYELSLKDGQEVAGNVYVAMTYRGIPLPWFYFKVDSQYARYNPWKSQYFSNGEHTVYGGYYDYRQREWHETHPITVTVYNEISFAPEILYPTDSSELSGDIIISFKAKRPLAFFAKIYTNNKLIGWTYLYRRSSPYHYLWRTTKVPNGDYDLKIVAYYLYTGYVTSDPIAVTVNNPETPIIEITCPDPTSGKTRVYLSSNDNARFIFPILYVDNRFMGYRRRMPCNIKWDTRKCINGPHTLRIRAYHLRLRRWISADKTVEVQN